MDESLAMLLFLKSLRVKRKARCTFLFFVVSLLYFTSLRFLGAIRALANLGVIDPQAIGLSDFGPNTSYFPRQIKSMSRVSAAQAKVKDIESHEEVGESPKLA